ncbi:MAG TPA: 30S ribosomal protein S8e [archaeon]|nr:30S ribosomal protein S8e [archaeon]
MTQWHLKSKKKISGGKSHTVNRSDKRLAWKGGDPALTQLETGNEERKDKKRGRGHNIKLKAKKAKFASVTDLSHKKTKKMQITSVKENNADRLYVRRNIITKGALIQVKDGESLKNARVTSRPGQSGTVSAILVEEKVQK